jgi:hypothetical protein
MQRRAFEMSAQAHRLLDEDGALDDVARLDQANRLLAESHRLLDASGPLIAGQGVMAAMVGYMRAERRRELHERHGRRSRSRTTRTTRPLVEPPPDAPWPQVERYIRERRRRELGIDYDA